MKFELGQNWDDKNKPVFVILIKLAVGMGGGFQFILTVILLIKTGVHYSPFKDWVHWKVFEGQVFNKN